MNDETDALLDEIRRESDALERALLRGKRMLPEALEAERPGTPDGHRADTPGDWLHYLRWLDRAVIEQEKPATPATGKLEGEVLDQLLADMIAESPQPVVCSDGETRHVYPKSYHALRFLDALDATLRGIARERHIALGFAVAGDPTVEMLAPLMESDCVCRWAWVIAHEEPGLPFDEHAAPAPAPPKWTRQLTVKDWTRFLVAHQRVNGEQLRLAAAAFPPDPDNDERSRLTLAGFLGSLTAEMEPGAAKRLLRQTSLGQVFAAQITRAASQREAMAKAKTARESAS